MQHLSRSQVGKESKISNDGRTILGNSEKCQTCLLIWTAIKYFFPAETPGSSKSQKVLDASKSGGRI